MIARRIAFLIAVVTLVIVAAAITILFERHGRYATWPTSVSTLTENSTWAAACSAGRWSSWAMVTQLDHTVPLPQERNAFMAWRNQLRLPYWVRLPSSTIESRVDTFYVRAYGYPLRSFVITDASNTTTARQVTSGVSRHWGPFIANIAIFTLCLAMPTALCVAVGRRLRVRRGVQGCQCRYPRLGLNTDVCPECGVKW